MKKALFLFGFGLLPSWAAWIVVLAGSIDAPSGYWNAAPWLIVISLPVSAITIGIAGVSLIVHAWKAGEPDE